MHGARMHAWVPLALVACGCGTPDLSPVMRPGEDCTSCHNGDQAQEWTVAGTVFSAPDAQSDGGVQGALVLIADANGRQLTLRSNSAGNFYTAEPLQFPLTVSVAGTQAQHVMTAAVEVGACNACHVPATSTGDPGRVYVEP